MLWNISRHCCRNFTRSLWTSGNFSHLLNRTPSSLSIRRCIFNYVSRTCPKDGGKWKKGSGVVLKFSFALSVSYAARSWAGKTVVHCDADHFNSRIVGLFEDELDKEVCFDWKQFMHMLWSHIFKLVLAVISAFCVALCNIRIPLILGGVVDNVTKLAQDGSKDFIQHIIGPAVRLLIMYLNQALFTFSYIYLLSSVGESVATKLKQELFKSVMKQDIEFFDRRRTGEIINRLTTDIQEFKSSFKLCISQGLRSSTQIIGCAVSLFVISPEMATGMLIGVPVIVIIGTLFGSVLRKYSREAQAQGAKATLVGEEAVSNIRTVRAFAMENEECKMYNHETELACKINERLGIGIGLFQAGTNLLLNGMVLSTLLGGGYLLCNSHVSPGDVMSFLVATQTIQRSLAQLSLLFGHMIRGLAAGTRVFEFINLEPKIPLAGGKKIPFHSLFADVKFEDVTFAYPTRPEQKVLKNFNLHIPSGKTVAIVGASGNGKSTVAWLLERIYDINRGSIKIDGIDIRELDPSWLRGQAIGFINQEPILFATTIMENIRYGRPDATDTEVIEVAKLVNADEFIQTFPDGYNTMVGERGVTVSGGQKQRIAIARALLKNPSIVILDEATSALDAESEKLVQDALDKVTKGRTVLVIAHRLSTVQNADIIVVLDSGVIVEIGTHEQLKKKKGYYWNLIQLQEKIGAS